MNLDSRKPADWIGAQIRLLRELSKSGIVTLVLVSVSAGYLLALPPGEPPQWTRLVLTLVGVWLLASGSSALNQLQESALDAKMPRTANRPIPSGRIKASAAGWFSGLTIFSGSVVLLGVDRVAFTLGLAAVAFYNGFYTYWWKPRWSYAAIPGAIPGAIPAWIGAAVASRTWISPAAIYVFTLVFFWQMPHFWVLAIRYQQDYAKGGFPTLPVTHGPGRTRLHIALWGLAYSGWILAAPFFLNTGYLTLVFAPLIAIILWWELWRYVFDKSPWIRFFLGVNFSLIAILVLACLDSWRWYLAPSFFR